MNIASFIAGRLVFQKQQSFSRFIIRLSIVATTISVAIMILALAFVAGFQEVISQKVFSFWGHVRVQQQLPSFSGLAEDLPCTQNDTVLQIMKSDTQVKWVDVFATKSAMLRTDASIEGVLLKGVDQHFNKERIQPFLKQGECLSFDTTHNLYSILISEYMAQRLLAKTGDKAYLYFIEEEGAPPRIRPVTIRGIYKTAIEEYDKMFAIVDLRLIQKINGWDASKIGGYEVTLHDYHQDESVSSRFLDRIPTSWYSTPVRKIYPNIFDWLQLQDTNKALIITILCIVAVINLITCLLILVLERSRMIGLLKALGAMNGQVQRVFWIQGLLITLTGIILGTIVGLGVCWLQSETGLIRLDETAYNVSVAPVKVVGWQILLVDVLTFLISFLILLLPSLLVKKISPVKALRFE